MQSPIVTRQEPDPVSRTLARALLRHPQVLQAVLEEDGLSPSDLALWGRKMGAGTELETLAHRLAALRRAPYRPLLERAVGFLRDGNPRKACPAFQKAHRLWQAAVDGDDPMGCYDGCKLLALWGECLYQLGQTIEARLRWLWALALAPDDDTRLRIARTIEKVGLAEDRAALLNEVRRHALEGAELLEHRWLKLDGNSTSLLPYPLPAPPTEARGQIVAVMADVSNLDLVCVDQYGRGRRLDYGRLLGQAETYGPVQIKSAFVPDMRETLAVRRHLLQVGFALDLKQPKLSHGRIAANADTAMAAAAVRWASDARVGRVELWTGDGDFLKVREVVNQAWPQVVVAFRSFAAGTAAGIRQLGEDWAPIGPQFLQERASPRHFFPSLPRQVSLPETRGRSRARRYPR